jgi:16S rRNA (guanine966-N2)-methyltransferase
MPADARKPPLGAPCSLVFLDPPYGRGLVPAALTTLTAAGWIVPEALIVAEIGSADEAPTTSPLLAERHLGAARVCVWRAEMEP